MTKQELITVALQNQVIAFSNRVDSAIANTSTVAGRKKLLDEAATLATYAKRLRASVEVETPIAVGVLKIKASIGELCPKQPGKPCTVPVQGFHRNTLTEFRKLNDNRDRFNEYIEQCKTSGDVPSQMGAIRFYGADSIIAAKHGNQVVEWYTPSVYVEKARSAMGGIDVDPASNKHAQKIIQAATFYDANDDGLQQDWRGNVWLNPPYKMPDVQDFVYKLCDSIESGEAKQAVLLTNNTTDPKWWQRAANLATTICFTSGRIAFYNRAGETSSPTNGQTFMYFGRAKQRFGKQFSDVGVLLCK